MAGRAVVVVQPDLGDGPDLLGEVLASRRRPTLAVQREQAPPDVDAVRAVAVLGAWGVPVVPRGLADWLDACVAAGVPLLAMGEGCGLLADRRSDGGGTAEMSVDGGATAGAVVTVGGRPEETGDPVFGDVPEGSRWPVTAPALAVDGTSTVVLATDDGSPLAIRAGDHVYLTRLTPYRRIAAFCDRLPDLAERLLPAAVFCDGLARALLGRWVDKVVGRTADEAPWGRRGPAPVPRPGLSLNPLRG